MKKLIINMLTVLCFCVVFAMFLHIDANAETVILSEDFSSYTNDISAPWVSLKTGYGVRDSFPSSESGGKFLKISPLTAWPYNVKRDVSAQCGRDVFRLKFDIMIDGTDGGEYLDFYIALTGDSGENYGVARINTSITNGNFDVYNGMMQNGLSGNAKGLSDGTWYSVTAYLDFFERRISYYVDDIFWCETSVPESFNNINGVTLFSVAGSQHTSENPSPASVGIDNLSLMMLTHTDVKRIYASGGAIPHYLAEDIRYSAASGRTGNVFYDKNVSFNISVENVSDNAQRILSRAVVYTESGEVIQKSEFESEIGSKECYEKTVSFSLEKYGIYLLRISDEHGKYDRIVQFSVCNAPIGDKNTRLGVDTDFYEDRGEVSKTMELISNAGFGITRELFNWERLDPDGNGAKLTDKYNSYLNTCKTDGVEVYATAAFSNSAYTSEYPPSSDAAVKSYAEFCGDLAKKLAGKAGYIEIWNEYMLSGFNRDGAPPEHYGKMLMASYEQIKKNNPDIKVCAFVLPGVTNTVSQGSVDGLSPLGWLERVLDYLNSNGGLGCFDAVSVHPYMLTVYPDSGELLMKSNYDGLKVLLARYGLENIPIIASETGQTTQNEFIDDEMQAVSLVRSAVLNDVYKMYDRLIIYNFQRYTQDNENRDGNFGIINSINDANPYTARLSYVALCNYNRLMTGAEFVDNLNDDNARLYKFKNGKEFYVFWAKGKKHEIKIYTDKLSAILCDMYGNESVIYSQNGVFTVLSDSNVRYLLLPDNESAYVDIAGNIQLSADAGYAKVYSSIESDGYSVITSSDAITVKDTAKCTVTLSCDTEVCAGAVVRANVKGEYDKFYWQFRPASDSEFKTVSVDEGNSFAIGNAHTDGYLRAVCKVGDDVICSSAVYVQKLLNSAGQWETNLPMREYSPESVLFTADGKTFAMLDRDVKKGEMFVTVTEAKKGYCHAYYVSETPVQRFDVNDKNSVAYFVNTSDFKNAVIGSELQRYIKTKDWITESGGADGAMSNQSIVRSDVSLLSYNEYKKYIDRIGYNLGANAVGQFLRTPSGISAEKAVYIPNSTARIASEYTNKGATLIYPRAVFVLDTQFLRYIKLDVPTMGDEIKRVIKSSFTASQLIGTYSLTELMDIGFDVSETDVVILSSGKTGDKVYSHTTLSDCSYIWQYSNRPYGEFSDIDGENSSTLTVTDKYSKDCYIRLKVIKDGENYYSNPIKISDNTGYYRHWITVCGMTEQTPNRFVFGEESCDKTFILLDSEGYGENKRYYILRNDYSKSLNGKIGNRFDISDTESAAYVMNTDEFTDNALSAGMKNYVPTVRWKIPSSDFDKYGVNCKLLLISADEYLSYADKIGYAIGSNWWLRTPVKREGTSETPKYMCLGGLGNEIQTAIKSDYMTCSYNLRPAFYLTRDYFRENRIDIYTAGSAVLKMLREDFSGSELSAIYTDAELGIIFDSSQTGEADNHIVSDVSMNGNPVRTYFWSSLKDMIPLGNVLEIK